MPNLKDAGKDVQGGLSGPGTPTPYRFDLLSPLAMAALAELRDGGAKKYGPWTFRDNGGTVPVHVNKAMMHIFAYLAGDTTEKDGRPEEHLLHAFCRLMFAVDIIELRKQSSVAQTAVETFNHDHHCHCYKCQETGR